MFYAAIGEFGTVVEAGGKGGYSSPKPHEDRDGRDARQEQKGPFPTADFGFEVPGDANEEEKEKTVIEGTRTSSFCRDGGIRDRGRVRR